MFRLSVRKAGEGAGSGGGKVNTLRTQHPLPLRKETYLGDTLDYEGKFESSWEKGRKALVSCPGINLASVNSVSTERGFPFGSLSGERKTISGNETLRSRYFPVSCICTGYSGVGLVKRESGYIYIFGTNFRSKQATNF